VSVSELEKIVIKLASDIKEDRVLCRFENIRTRIDKYNRLVIQVIAHCSQYGKVVFNYSPQKAKMLVDALKNLNIQDVVVGRCYELKRVDVEKVRDDYTQPYPAWLPAKLIDCTYVE